MELRSIEDAFDRVAKKQKLSSSKCQEVIEQIVHEIEQTLSRIQSAGNSTRSLSDHQSVLGELKTKLKEIAPLSQLESTQKELNIALSKYQKPLEKSFNPDISTSYRNVDFKIHTVNKIIRSHFYREGLFEIGDLFVKESQEDTDDDERSYFFEMHKLLRAIKSGDLSPALHWAGMNKEKLKQNESDLDFKLHALQFIETLENQGRDEALKYVQTHLVAFGATHMPKIQKLMGSLLYAGKLSKSPYSELILPAHWDKVAQELAQQFCSFRAQSYESPLSVAIAAGVQGLPTLLKMVNVMVGKKQDWQSMKELPVPVDLCSDFQFHSIFVCPVSRDQASDENPPMLMSCGHVLCKQSITKLSKNNSTRPFKCPYCPSEVEVGKCRQLYL